MGDEELLLDEEGLTQLKLLLRDVSECAAERSSAWDCGVGIGLFLGPTVVHDDEDSMDSDEGEERGGSTGGMPVSTWEGGMVPEHAKA